MGDNAYREVTELLARRRRRAEEDADLRRDELYGSLPRLRQFDAEIAGVCRQMTAAALEGEPTEKYHAALERIKQERRQTLAEAGIAEDLLLDTLTPGDTLLNHMAAACHWDPKRYLEFEEE